MRFSKLFANLVENSSSVSPEKRHFHILNGYFLTLNRSVAVCVVLSLDLSLDLLRRCLVFQRSRMVLAAAVVVASEGFQRCGIGHGQRCGVGRGRWFMVKAMEGMVQAV
nr:hypothetical protein Iba_scaffold2337CG0240 [Ipomoea batatas]